MSTTLKKGIRFRIYPNKNQQKLINQTFGCCRLIFNKGLDMRNIAFTNGEKCNYSHTSKMLTELKATEEFRFLKEVDSIALQQTLRDLDRGFVNFFEKRSAHPVFKSKHNHHQSYRTINVNNSIRISGKYLKLPKLGYVKVRQSMEVSNINNVTIERTPTGKYFAVLNVDFTPELRPNAGGKIGIDMGLKSFCKCSNGTEIPNPKYLEKSMKRLIKEQRKLSRMTKFSNNWNKQRIKVALIYEKITNQRNDFLQKQSSILLRENQTICIEDLNVRGMIRNHKLAKSIGSVSWSKFFDMLEYKASWYGCEIITVPRFYASSQTCNCCGSINKKVKKLSVRNWTCPICNAKHDRDINAAINILNKGLELRAA